MNFILAAAGTSTNATLQLSNSPLIERFEQVTGLPREVAVWGVNILAALIILFIGYILSGFVRGLVRVRSLRSRGAAVITVCRSAESLWCPQARQGAEAIRWSRVACRTAVKEISSGSMPRLIAAVTA